MAVLNKGLRLDIPDSTPSGMCMWAAMHPRWHGSLVPTRMATDVADLVKLCWHADPKKRPSFLEVR